MTQVEGQNEGGFGIVELLVALAIAATVLVGIGALFTAAGDLQHRAAETSTIVTTLVDLQALASLANGDATTLVIANVAADGFTLQRQENVQSSATSSVTAFKLWDVDGKHLFEISRGSRVSSVDLSIFGAVSLEYFASDAKVPRWTDWKAVDSSVAAARLVLPLGSRVWRPLIWVGDIYR